MEGHTLSIFEVVFNLTGLVLGFALVEVLSGLAKTFRARGPVQIGWLTPLLGVWVLFDVTTFWGSAWEMRNLLPSVWQSLGPGLVITSVYYLAASQVFPEHIAAHTELDSHYWKVRRFVIGLVLACNCATWVIGLSLGRRWGPVVTCLNVSYAITLVALIVIPGKRLNVALLLALIGILIWGFAFP
jgi:hypothetical protein